MKLLTGIAMCGCIPDMSTPGKILAILCAIVSGVSLHAQSPSGSTRDQTTNALTTTAAVQALSAEEAAKGYPVKLRGVVTFSQDWWRLLFVQDSTGGIYCEPAGLPVFPAVGSEVEIEGISGAGSYLPVVIVKNVLTLGPTTFPSAVPATSAQLWKGEFDGDMVRVSGHIIAAKSQKLPTPFLDILLLSDKREIKASVLGLSNSPPDSLLGSHVEIQGVFGPKINEHGQISGVGILTAKPEMLQILSTVEEIAGTLQIDAPSSFRNKTNTLVRIRGVVTTGGTSDFWLGDEHGGINVRNSSNSAVKRGDALEIIGTIQNEGKEPKLSLLRILSATPGTLPPPDRITATALFDPKRHGQIVRTEGEFLHRVPSDYGDILVLRDGEISFEARIRYPAGEETRKLSAGSRLQLTGVLRMLTAEDGDNAVPRVLIMEPADLKTLTPPPWPMRQTLAVVTTLAISLGFGLVGLSVAHRRLKESNHRVARADSELRNLNADLERRIRFRTAELEATNEQLQREINERQKVQETLSDREAKYRTMVERVDAIVWEFDSALDRMVYVSPQAATLGYPMEDWLKPGFWANHIHPDDRDYALTFCSRQTALGANHEFQCRFINANGTVGWFDDKVTVETRADGSHLLRGVFIDITERKQQEAALRESEERFTKAFHASPAISAITSYPDGILLDINERFLQASGYRREDILGHTTVELGLWANPNRRQEFITTLERGESVREAEYDIVDKQGRLHTFLTSLERIVIGGKPCILSINQEITERKQREEALRESEERFTKAFHASPEIIVISRQADARYIDVNERFTQVLGYTRDEAIGKTAFDLGIWVDPSRRHEFISIIESGRPVRNFECVFRGKTGSHRTMLLSIEKIVLGGEACLLGINNDITDRKNAERLRDEQNQVLEMIAQGAPLDQTLARLTLAIEAQAEGMLCSVLLLDKDGQHLRHGAAPSLPSEYNQQIDGIAIGASVGSCGTAAYRREPVIVEDIQTDPLWADFRQVAILHDLRSCWSTPIFDAQHGLLGTFAIYYRKPGRPTDEHIRLIHTATHTAAICIKRALDEESLQESERTLRNQNELLNEMGHMARIGAWSLDLATEKLTWSDEIYRIHELPLGTKPVVCEAIDFYAPEARPVISAAVQDATKNGTPWDLELPFVTAEGRRRWVRTQGQVEFADNRPVRLYGAFQDITTRKQIEEALRLSEERFAKAFQVSPAITVITSRSNGRYLDVNERFTEIMGYTREEVIGKTSIELNLWTHPGKRAELFATLESKGCVRDVECDYVDKFQRHHTMLTSIEPITIGGEPCLLSVNHDITERKRIANGLRALVSSINGGSTTDFFTKLSQQISELFQTRYALVAELMPGNHEQVRSLGVWAGGRPADNFRKSIAGTPCAMVLSEGMQVLPSRVQQLFPGDRLLAQLNVESYAGIAILDGHRNPIGLLAVLHDKPWNPPSEFDPILRLFAESAGVEIERSRSLAALHAAETRFRMAIENSFDCLTLTNADGICTYISPAVTRLLGYSPDEITGRPASTFVLPQDLSAYQAHRQHLLANPDLHAELEIRVCHKNGTTRWIQSADTNRLHDPNLQAVVSNFRDITERKHAETIQASLEVQLRQSQKMEAIGTLAGGVAHDFNNILGAIIGCAELTQLECPDNPAALANLNDLLKASHRAKDLVRQILTFSRRDEFQRRVISLEPIFSESIRLLRAALPANIDLQTSLLEPLPVVFADATLVQQVIMNLATNGSQAIGNRPGQVQIMVRQHTVADSPDGSHPDLKPGTYVMIQVRDNGCGMEPAVVERIFEPFFTTKGPGQGTGLGLSVVHGIVTAHEGVIRVESKPGVGSTFSILLPSAEGRKPAQATPPPPLPPSRGTERILLVDDEQALLAVGEKLLRRCGYQVTACHNPEEAFEIFRKAPSDFDLIITDYSMPALSGADLARKILEIRPTTPIVVCTGYTTRLNREQALQMGFCDLLSKPINLEELHQAVRHALGESSDASRQP